MSGSNPSLAVRVTANLEELKRQLAAGGVEIQKTSAQMAKMADAFNGTKLVQQVAQSTVAIQSLKNGVNSLNAADAAKQLDLFNRALEKMRLTGQPIPEMMQRTANELQAVKDKAEMAAAAAKGTTTSAMNLGTTSTDLTGKLKSLAGTLGIAFGATAVVAGLKSLISNTFTYAENITDLAARMDVSTDAAQGWKFATEQTGSSLEDVSKAVLKLSQGLSSGDKGLAKALADAGLSMAQIRDMKPEDAFNAVAGAIAKVPNPMDQSRIALEAFGKSGAAILPAIRQGMVDLAGQAPKMTAEQIKALDEAKDAWQKFGRTVTVVTGRMLADTASGFRDVATILKNFGAISSEAWNNGMDAALRLTGELGRYKNAIYELTDAQKKEVDQLLKNGIPANQIYDKSLGKNEASVLAYIASLDKTKKPHKDFSDGANDAAAKVAAFQKAVDGWSGKAVASEVDELRKVIEAVGGSTKLTKVEYERWIEKLNNAKTSGSDLRQMLNLSRQDYERLGKELDSLKTRGADLSGWMRQVWMGHELLNPSIKRTTDAYYNLAAILKTGLSYKLDSAPSLPLPFKTMTADEWKSILNLGKMPDLAKPPAAEFGYNFKTSFAKSLEGLGGIVVGAIQGGGNVGKALFSSIGGSLGNDLGAAITNGLSKTLADGTKAAAGSFAKMLGGLAGPLGALAGSALGGLFDKLFGKNEGRESAKAFAATFGGFDALLKRMVDTLGPSYEKLWIDLTQNTKGPAQVAQAIKAIEDAFARQGQASEDAAAKATEGATREIDAQQKVRDAIQAKIDDITREYDSLAQAVAQEQEEEVMGVIEAQQRAAMAELAKKKETLEDELKNGTLIMEQAKKETLDLSQTLKDGMRRIFEEPFKMTFDWSGMPSLPGSGGARPLPVPIGGGGLGRPTLLRSSAPIVIEVTSISQLDGREVARNQMRYLPSQLVLAGR